MEFLKRCMVFPGLVVAALLFACLFWATGTVSAQKEEKSKSEKPAKADKEEKEGFTRLRIEVVAGDKDEPVDSASVYVRFVHERALAKDQKVEMNVKTNRNGVAVLSSVPRGKVTIQVIAPGWKTFGQWYGIDKAEQTVHIKLQKPPRWY